MSFLDQDITELKEVAGFEVPHNGIYTMTVTVTQKTIANKEAIEASFDVVECNEPENPEQVSQAGTKFSTAFFIDNEYGISNLKKFLLPFCSHFGITRLADLIPAIHDTTVMAKVVRQVDKKDSSKIYARVSELNVL